LETRLANLETKARALAIITGGLLSNSPQHLLVRIEAELIRNGIIKTPASARQKRKAA